MDPSIPDEPTPPLSGLRETIEAIDRDLVRLVHERMRTVREVGRLKNAHSAQPLRDGERERELFAFWAREGERYGLSGYHLGRLLRELLNWSRRDQERFLEGAESARAGQGVVRVAFQGERHAYSDLAARKLFASRGATLRTTGRRTFEATFDALESGEVEYALLPVENTIVGSIEENWRGLTERAMHIVDEEVWHVEHVLAALPGARLADLTRVRSHPVALAQCGRFLTGLVGTSIEEFHDTAGAAVAVAQEGDPTIAAVCSEEAASGAGLDVLARDVADRHDNVTRFLLLSREAEPVDARLGARTSIVFTVRHERGALAACLGDLAAHGVNLTKLESRPLQDAPWEYLFHADLDGDAERDPLRAALDAMRAHTLHLRVLGSYPRRAGVGDEPVPDPVSEASEGHATPTREAAPKPLRSGSALRFTVGGVEVGRESFVCMVAPRSAIDPSDWLALAEAARARGAHVLHAGSQPIDARQLEALKDAGARYEMPVACPVRREADVRRVAHVAGLFVVEGGSMHDPDLLRILGRAGKPVVLERGPSATIDELLHAADCIAEVGNRQIVLCERGIRTFETATRNTLDVSAVPVLHARGPWPVIVDPCHALGQPELVAPLALAAAAAGADGLVLGARVGEGPGTNAEGELDAQQWSDLARRLEGVLGARGLSLRAR